MILQCPRNLLPSVYLCINKVYFPRVFGDCGVQLGPTWTSTELGVGESLLMKVIGCVTGRSVQKLKSDLKLHGDLGTVAQVLHSRISRIICVLVEPVQSANHV